VTLPPASGPGRPKPFVPANSVAAAALARAQRLLGGIDTTRWPDA
jgi:hypothetical protein